MALSKYQELLILNACCYRSEQAVKKEIDKLALSMEASKDEIRLVIETEEFTSKYNEFVEFIEPIVQDLKEKIEEDRPKAELLKVVDYLLKNLT